MTKCRVRPRDEWVEVDVPELRIVPQELWDKVQHRLRLRDVPLSNGRRNIGKYPAERFRSLRGMWRAVL